MKRQVTDSISENLTDSDLESSIPTKKIVVLTNKIAEAYFTNHFFQCVLVDNFKLLYRNKCKLNSNFKEFENLSMGKKTLSTALGNLSVKKRRFQPRWDSSAGHSISCGEGDVERLCNSVG